MVEQSSAQQVRQAPQTPPISTVSSARLHPTPMTPSIMNVVQSEEDDVETETEDEQISDLVEKFRKQARRLDPVRLQGYVDELIQHYRNQSALDYHTVKPGQSKYCRMFDLHRQMEDTTKHSITVEQLLMGQDDFVQVRHLCSLKSWTVLTKALNVYVRSVTSMYCKERLRYSRLNARFIFCVQSSGLCGLMFHPSFRTIFTLPDDQFKFIGDWLMTPEAVAELGNFRLSLDHEVFRLGREKIALFSQHESTDASSTYGMLLSQMTSQDTGSTVY